MSLKVHQQRKKMIVSHYAFYSDFLSGAEALTALRAATRREVDPLSNFAEFEAFMNELVMRKLKQSEDKEFLAKCEIRDLRREHKDELEEVDGRFYDAARAYQESDVCTRLEALDRGIRGGQQAVHSMRKFIESETEGYEKETTRKKGTIAGNYYQTRFVN